MIYDVTYFINKFEAIQDDRWLVGDYFNWDKSKSCALGHCGAGSDRDITGEATLLKSLFGYAEYEVQNINDGYNDRYHQPTPKLRILAALYDIRAKQQPKYEDITSELAVLPAEEVQDFKPVHKTVIA